mmetsp:Transcript_7344/g.13350  ORF Transcript_7344/g.13350 Transcript_7344/m.13350 type:complete len:216 (-) Transcript_7344:307-954(-)
MGTAIIQKTGIVRHNDGSDISEGVKVLLHPCNVDDIQVIGGLIHEQNIGLLKHGTREGELHAPSTRKRGHGVIGLGLAVRHETDIGKHSPDILATAAQSLNLGIDRNVVDTTQVTLFSLDIGLDENGTHVGAVGETLDGVVRDGSHEGGLSGIVTSEEAVFLTAKQLHFGVVKQNLGTVRQGELTVAQFFGIIFFIVLLGNDHHLLSLHTDLLNA